MGGGAIGGGIITMPSEIPVSPMESCRDRRRWYDSASYHDDREIYSMKMPSAIPVWLMASCKIDRRSCDSAVHLDDCEIYLMRMPSKVPVSLMSSGRNRRWWVVLSGTPMSPMASCANRRWCDSAAYHDDREMNYTRCGCRQGFCVADVFAEK